MTEPGVGGGGIVPPTRFERGTAGDLSLKAVSDWTPSNLQGIAI